MPAIEVWDDARQRHVRVWLSPAGWRSGSLAVEKRVRVAWRRFNWPEGEPGRLSAFVRAIGAKLERS